MGSHKQELLGLVYLIKTDSIREFTLRMLDVAPQAFWENRASRRHHPPDERGEYGTVIHTTRVLKLVRHINEVCNSDPLESSALESAASIHDLTKNGLNWEKDHSVEDHPFLVRKLAETYSVTCPYVDMIFGLVESHMGKWGDPPYVPKLPMKAVLHLADSISAEAGQIWEQLS